MLKSHMGQDVQKTRANHGDEYDIDITWSYCWGVNSSALPILSEPNAWESIDVFNQSTSFENDLAKAAREGKINVRQADTKLVLKFQDDQHCRRVFTKMLLDAYQGERPLTSVACNNNKSSIVEEDGGDLHSVLIKVFQTDTTKYKEWKMLGKDIKLALAAYNDDKGGHTCVQNVKGAELQAALENIGARLSAKVYITEDDGKKLQGRGYGCVRLSCDFKEMMLAGNQIEAKGYLYWEE